MPKLSPTVSRPLLLGFGWLNVAIGVLGIFLPLLPTTIFLLIAAWCFGVSSPRLHSWLIHHPRLGPIIQAGRSGAGMPRKVRNRVIALMWLGMTVSVVIIGQLWALLLLGAIGAAVTIFLARQPVY